MKKLTLRIAALFVSCLAVHSLLHAQEPVPPITFSRNDRVLVLAPHPDDESIGAAGVIQKARKAGANVTVVLYTNGDSNELAFIVYEKRLTFRKGEFLHMGEMRRAESIAAMASLGLPQEAVILLGYPDFGTMEILTKYWGNTRPYKSIFTRVTKVSYPEAHSFNAPYVGESILRDLESILLEFKPTRIFVSHPSDANRDHRALYLFLRIALWDLEGKMEQPEVLPYLIHATGWPRPRGYHPELALAPPVTLRASDIVWKEVPLSEEEVKTKHDAIRFYRSEVAYNPPYLFTFARANELFGDFPVVSPAQQWTRGFSWEDVNSKEYESSEPDVEEAPRPRGATSITYAIDSEDLYLQIHTKRERLGLSIFLLGYSKKTPFAAMPKINLILDRSGLHIKDKKATLFIPGAKLARGKHARIIKLPLAALGNPDRLLSCVSGGLGDLSPNDKGWRIITVR